MKRYDKNAWIEWVGKKEGISIYKQLLEIGRMNGEEGDMLNRSSVIVLKQAWVQDEIEKGKKCAKCGSEKKLTLDHIIPVQILLQFGIDEPRCFMPENYRLLCNYCNGYKGHRLDFTEPKTKSVLLDLLNDL